MVPQEIFDDLDIIAPGRNLNFAQVFCRVCKTNFGLQGLTLK